MAEQATERTTIGAPPDLVYQTALDIEAYPEWAQDIKEATVVDRDDEGRPLRVRFRAAAMGHSARYVLSYDHSEAPRKLSWILEQGDIVRKLDGEYVFEPAADGGTEVTYHLEAELAVPLPGFIKRRAESKIMTVALEELRHRCEDATVR